MNIFGIGLPEMAVIAAIGLLVFGPKRLPELGKTLGRTLKGFQSASSEFEKEFRSAMANVDGAEAPAPLAAGTAEIEHPGEATGAGELLTAAEQAASPVPSDQPAPPPA
jgi:sec-independent protein translocase protein TatA